MTTTAGAIAIRPGEHACFRFQRQEERERIADAFMCVGLRLGHRVVYLCESRDVDSTLLRLTAAEPDVASALGTGALEVRDANTVYLDDRSSYTALGLTAAFSIESSVLGDTLRQPRAARLVHRPRVAHGAWGAGIV